MTTTTQRFPERLSGSDSLMWRIESDPVLRSPIVVVCLFDREPSWPTLLTALDRAANGPVPRLRQRIVPIAPGTARLHWIDDPEFAIAHHVRRVRARTPGGIERVLELAAPEVMSAFDPARPPWHLDIVTGLHGRQAAAILRFHHSLSDGVGAVQLAEALFDQARDGGRAAARATARATAGSPRGGAKRKAPGASAKAAEPAPAAESAGPATGGPLADLLGLGARAATDPLGTLRTTMRTTRSMARLLGPGKRQSPLLVERSLDRDLRVVELPLADLVEAGRRIGATVNDVFLGAVGGALHAYHRELGVELDQLRVTMPVNTRSADDERGGNHFTPTRFTLPVDDPDPVVRALIARSIVRRNRTEPALRSTGSMASALNLLPRPVVTRLFGDLFRSVDIDAVDVPGLRRDAYLGGARVERLWAFAPPVGAALSVTLVSHLDTACIGLACDRAAVSDPDLLLSCLVRSLDEAVAATPPDHLRRSEH